MRHSSNDNRPALLDASPFETLPRRVSFHDDRPEPVHPVSKRSADSQLGKGIEKYLNIYREFVHGEAVPEYASVDERPDTINGQALGRRAAGAERPAYQKLGYEILEKSGCRFSMKAMAASANSSEASRRVNSADSLSSWART